MTQVTAVDAYWLAELGAVFYSVKEKNFNDSDHRSRTSREFSKRAELEMEMEMTRQRDMLASKITKDIHPIKLSRSTKIAAPGTPRTIGNMTGARVPQTPRRRAGL